MGYSKKVNDMKHIGSKIIITLLVTIFSVQATGAYLSLDYDEQWQGTLLWLPAEGVDIPSAHLDPAKWVAYFPGSWDKPMVAYSMAALANSGIKDFYWDAINQFGMVLYPSKIAKAKVYRNQNSGVDFYKTDMVKIAIDVARRNSINLKLVAYLIDDDSKKLLDELLTMYPDVEIVVIGGKGDFKDKRVKAVSSQEIDGMLDAANRDQNPTRSHHYNMSLTKKYLHAGKVLFKKEFTIYDTKDRCLLAVAAREKWTVFVNGKLLGSGKWYPGKFQDQPVCSHTYEINDVIKKGKNTIVVCAESSAASIRAFIANIRTGDMIYPCDGSWQAVAIDNTPMQQDFNEIMDEVKGAWRPALQLGRPNVRLTIGTIHWNRIEK